MGGAWEGTCAWEGGMHAGRVKVQRCAAAWIAPHLEPADCSCHRARHLGCADLHQEVPKQTGEAGLQWARGAGQSMQECTAEGAAAADGGRT